MRAEIGRVATPLAMALCSHPYAATALVLEWHVIGMFLPGLATGALITRFGTLPIIFAGCLLLLACIGTLSHPALDFINTTALRDEFASQGLRGSDLERRVGQVIDAINDLGLAVEARLNDQPASTPANALPLLFDADAYA